MLLNILEFPDPRLRKVATPVAAVTPEIVKLIRDMAETMYAAPGIGLAATQVDVHKRIVVMDLSETKDELRVFINPEIVAIDGRIETEEGCRTCPCSTTSSSRRSQNSSSCAGRWRERWRSRSVPAPSACS